MRAFLILFLFVPALAHARLIINYDLNYSSQSTDTNNVKGNNSRTYNKVFIGGSLNDRKTFFFGWNINSWSAEQKSGQAKETYSALEMGPKLLWFLNDNYNLYLNVEWNPYVKGTRKPGSGSSEKISGSSYGLGIGYRFRLSKLVGLGASVQYQTTNIDEAKVGSNSNNVSDTVSHLMPMLSLSLMFK